MNDKTARLALANDALANRIEEQEASWLKAPDGAEFPRVIINVSPAERDRIVTALRTQSLGTQAPVAWRWQTQYGLADEWEYTRYKPGVDYRVLEPLYASPVTGGETE